MNEGIQEQEQELESLYVQIQAKELKSEEVTRKILGLPDALILRLSNIRVQHELKQQIKSAASDQQDLAALSESI